MTLRLREKGTGIEQHRPCFFVAGPEKPFRATPNAVAMFTREVIDRCLRELQERARQSGGLAYIQVFDSDEHADNLWFVDDNGEGAITALQGSEY